MDAVATRMTSHDFSAVAPERREFVARHFQRLLKARKLTGELLIFHRLLERAEPWADAFGVDVRKSPLPRELCNKGRYVLELFHPQTASGEPLARASVGFTPEELAAKDFHGIFDRSMRDGIGALLDFYRQEGTDALEAARWLKERGLIEHVDLCDWKRQREKQEKERGQRIASQPPLS